jgi:Rod binding domain-containing protein
MTTMTDAAALISRNAEPKGKPAQSAAALAGRPDPKQVAGELAGTFYRMVIREMGKTVPKNDYFGSRGEEIFRSMWEGELGRQMGARPGDPLATAILREIAKHTGTAVGSAAQGDSR